MLWKCFQRNSFTDSQPRGEGDNIEEKEHDRIEQNKNNTNSNEIPHGDTMEEVMRKLEETDVAIKSVHHVPSEMENEYVPDAL